MSQSGSRYADLQPASDNQIQLLNNALGYLQTTSDFAAGQLQQMSLRTQVTI
jgi:hypothetical protein